MADQRPRLKVGPVTAVLCAICVVVFLTGNGPARVAPAGYLPAERIWDGGYWALLTSAFVHVETWHVVFNVWWLWALGMVLERALGWHRYLAFMLAAAVLSSAAQLGFSGQTGIGASGVVYAVFGALWAGRNQRSDFHAVASGRNATLMWIWLPICVVLTVTGTMAIGNDAHVSGVLFGLGVGAVAFVPKFRRPAIAGLIVLTAVSMVLAFYNPWSERWVAHRARADIAWGR